MYLYCTANAKHNCYMKLSLVFFQLGYTPLHRAASKGHTEAIELLLSSKCKVDSQDEVINNQTNETIFFENFWRIIANLQKYTVPFCIQSNLP